MGLPVYQTISAVGTATPIALDFTLTPFNASYAVTPVGNSTATFSIWNTYDDVNDATITPVYFKSASVTGNATGSFLSPIRFVRLEVSVLSAGGTVRFAVLQGLND